jgi:hypothetical protein
MKYMKFVMAALVAAALLVSTTLAATNAPLASAAADNQWTFSLAGGGSSALTGDNASAVGLNLELGHAGKLVLPMNAGVRQGVGYADADGADSTWVLSTKLFSDWTVLKLGNLQFDVGGNAGINYGNTTLTWTAAPEAVVRLYLKKDVDVFGRVEYPFNLNEGRSQQQLVYVLGVRVGF